MRTHEAFREGKRHSRRTRRNEKESEMYRMPDNPDRKNITENENGLEDEKQNNVMDSILARIRNGPNAEDINIDIPIAEADFGHSPQSSLCPPQFSSPPCTLNKLGFSSPTDKNLLKPYVQYGVPMVPTPGTYNQNQAYMPLNGKLCTPSPSSFPPTFGKCLDFTSFATGMEGMNMNVHQGQLFGSGTTSPCFTSGICPNGFYPHPANTIEFNGQQKEDNQEQ